MARIKSRTIEFSVKVKVSCKSGTDITQKEWDKEDFKEMVPYLKEKIKDEILYSWQWAAEVTKVTVKNLVHNPKS